MNNEKSDFLSPSGPMIIVKKLTKEVVEDAIKVYAENNGYYLKFYAAYFDIKTLNVLNNRKVARSKLLDELLEKGESIDIENYDFIDYNIFLILKLFYLSFLLENTQLLPKLNLFALLSFI